MFISLKAANRIERPTTSSGPPIRPPRPSPSTGPLACIAWRGTSSRRRPRRPILYQLNSRMGDALANAGRGAEAAAAYLAAVRDAPAAAAIELQRKAAMQFLISGHIDDGLATLRTVLEAIGMSLPRTPRRALFSLLIQRARLRIRGLGYRERDPSQIAPADLTRIDVCWSAGAGLSVVDTIRGADFQARGLLLSLAAGEPSRIARSLAMEAAHAASTGGSNRKTTARLLDRAGALASRVEDPYASGMVALARGVCAYLEGQWTLAQLECDRAETIFRDGCTGVAWELDTSHAFALWGLSHQGAVAELSRRWPILLDRARARGDLYAVMNLSSYIMSIVRLAADEPDTADRELRQTMSQWSREGYHVQHNDALWAAVQIELYRGDGKAAWNLIDQSWPALRRSLLLRVQFIRTSMNFLRAVPRSPRLSRYADLGRPKFDHFWPSPAALPAVWNANACRARPHTLDSSAARWPRSAAIRLGPCRCSPRPSHVLRPSTCASAPRQLAVAWESSRAAHRDRQRSIAPLAGWLTRRSRIPIEWPP